MESSPKSSDRPIGRPDRGSGFTLLETVAGSTVIIVGLLAVAGVIVSVSRERERLATAATVLSEAEALLEELKGLPPGDLKRYDGRRYDVSGVEGLLKGRKVLEVEVDDRNERLLVVTVRGSWNVRGGPQSLLLRTAIFDPQGKKR